MRPVLGIRPDWSERGCQAGVACCLNSNRWKLAAARFSPRARGPFLVYGGRLNPIRDTSDRTYLYADNIAIDEGRQQPVSFRPGKPLRLTDAHGAELSVTIVDIIGQSALIEYRPFGP